MPIVSGSFNPDPNDQPGGYEGTFVVSSPPNCPNKTLQVKVNVVTGTVSVQGPNPGTDPNTGQPKTTGSTTSTNQQTTTTNGAPPTTHQSPAQNQGGSSGNSTGTTHNGSGQTTGTSTAIKNANQQAGQSTDPSTGQPNGTSSTTWSVTVTTCYPGDPECCYSITISGSNPGGASPQPSAPSAS